MVTARPEMAPPDRLPKIGELVQVRSRRWLVEDVVEPEGAGESLLVQLACADDDSQGQSLEVFWDYELDRRILQEEGWQDLASKGFDAPQQFAAFLHTLQWNCVTATNPNIFQAPFHAGIKIDAYQMEPLRKALLLPRVNLFIADDTGLGKTIEAGLFARELLLRKKVKTIVVAAPASVIEQWKAELEDRFGLVFEILDRAYLTRMRRQRGFGVNPWRTHSRFLISQSLLIDATYADPMREWLGPLLPEVCSSSTKPIMRRRRVADATGSRRSSRAPCGISVAASSTGCFWDRDKPRTFELFRRNRRGSSRPYLVSGVGRGFGPPTGASTRKWAMFGVDDWCARGSARQATTATRRQRLPCPAPPRGR